ncbi:MAG: hypothetical protein IJM98_05615, partial [Oscillospiraceae bacterium]|nr:hypothetical protein [Oscillospiraceae bacterium]
MKVKTSILSRALAMLLALVLSFANVPGLVLTAFAAEEKTTTVGTVMANGYDFSEAEQNLLKSGYLHGNGNIGYTLPTNEDVKVDPEKKEITATVKDGWTAVSAEILANGEFMESFTLTNGKGTYVYDGNAFSVKVNYVVSVKAATENQQNMLKAMKDLKQGVANLEAVAAQFGNLALLEQAMTELENFAENGVNAGPLGKVNLSDAGKAAIAAFSAQMEANGGKLDLTVMLGDYNKASKTYYLENKGVAMHEKVSETADYLVSIAAALKTVSDLLGSLIENGFIDETTAEQLSTVSESVNTLKSGLDAVLADSWYAAYNIDKVLVKPGDAILDALVKDLPGELKNPTLNKTSFDVEKASVQANTNRNNVTVKVVLNYVKENNIEEYGFKTAVVTLDQGSSAEKIIAGAKDVVDAALAEWAEVYTEDGYKVTVSEIPATLTEDIEVTYTYAPVDCEITGGIEELPTSVPYGYVITLPVHEDPLKAYDYTVNDVAYAQGEDVTILGATEITRTFGKSYTTKNLYAIIAENYGDELAKAILTSGALKGDETISYRKPDPTEAEDLVKLEGGQVSAQATYASAYNNFDWVPYTYGVNGDEKNFNGASSAEHLEDSVKVVYRLDLENYSKEDVQAILNLAATLKADANDQIGVMNNLADMLDELKQLDEGKFGALVGVIGVTDFTPEDGTKEDEANKYMQGYFSDVVNKIINNHLDPDAFLKIYNMVVKYSNEGLEYYYENAAAIINEVTKLAGYLGNMTDGEEALKILVAKAGFPEYAEKITDVEVNLNNILAALKAPNAAIDVESENLYKLVKALTDGGETSCTATGSPYILSEALKATDASQTYVQVIININGERISVDGAEVVRGTVLSEEYVANLKNAVEAKVNETLGANKAHYNFEGKNLDELVGETLSSKLTIEHTYTEKAYTFIIEGEAETQTVTVNSLKVKLPGHPKAAENWEYRYTIDGVEGITKPEYVFTVEQLNNLFAGGSYTVSRAEVDVAKEKLEGVFSEWLVKDVNGNVTGLYAKVDANKDGVMAFATTIINSGYSYIGLNGEPLLYMNADNATEVRLQTLINAILKDNQFSNETLVELGNNGKGEFVHASMQLGTGEGIVFEDLDFTLYLNSVPSQMATVAKGLEKVESYMTFKSNNGVMAVDVTLPEKVYEVYLAALIATGNVDKD